MNAQQKNNSQMKTQKQSENKRRKKPCISSDPYMYKCMIWSMRNGSDSQHTFDADHFESIAVAIRYDSVGKRVYRFRCCLFHIYPALPPFSFFLTSPYLSVRLLWLKGKVFFLPFPSFTVALNFIFNNVLHTQ